MAEGQPGIFAQGTRAHYHLEFDLSDGASDENVRAAVLHTHSRVLQDLGQPERALACYRQCLDIAHDLRSRVTIAAACHGIGTVLAQLGQWDDSRQHLNVAQDLYAALGDKAGAAQVRAALEEVCQAS